MNSPWRNYVNSILRLRVLNYLEKGASVLV
jgi:hypothetical protein